MKKFVDFGIAFFDRWIFGTEKIIDKFYKSKNPFLIIVCILLLIWAFLGLACGTIFLGIFWGIPYLFQRIVRSL